MKEYQPHLENYQSDYYLSEQYAGNWGDLAEAEAYLQKYWLGKKEFAEVWAPIKDDIFDPEFHSLPQKAFLPGFELIPIVGGGLFNESEFKAFQKCLQHAGDKEFVIIHNTFGGDDTYALRMKYPGDISYEEIISGNFISAALFDFPMHEYFIFGNTGKWANYIANEYKLPMHIIAAKSDMISYFLKTYEVLREEYELRRNSFKKEELVKSFPESYRSDYIIH